MAASDKSAAILLAHALFLAFLAVPSLSVRPLAAQDFYAGKIIRLIVDSAPGGGYDANARLVARHIARFIPRTPTIIVTTMTGASGMTAVNYLYAQAPRDGTTIATFNSGMPLYQALGTPGVHYKAEEFSWIGNVSQDVNVITVWAATGVRTIEDAKRQEIVVGALTNTGTMGAYPQLLNHVLGTRFKVVTGYEGANAVKIAMERGELQGHGTTAWASWKITRPDWIKEGKIVTLVQIGSRKNPELAGVPLLDELAETAEQQQMFRLLGGGIAIERPFAGPPEVPRDRLEMLRRAFDRTMKDAAFLADAARERADISPHTGEETAEIVRQIVSTPASVVAEVKAATGIK